MRSQTLSLKQTQLVIVKRTINALQGPLDNREDLELTVSLAVLESQELLDSLALLLL